LFSRPRRRAERQAEGSTKRHRPLSYANVAATIALVLALGGGTAWAVKHIIHYKITKLGQIAPGVVSQLKTPGLSGAAGPAGPTGPSGTNGTNGTNGATGPQGPGATSFVTTINADTETSAIGNIPIELDCQGNTANPSTAFLRGTATSSFSILFENGGSYFSTWTYAASHSGGSIAGTPEQTNGSWPSSGQTYLAGSYEDVVIGHAVLTYYSGRFILGQTIPSTTETVDFALSEGSGLGSDGSCTIDAQIVPGS
jgi:hypothetical protein